MSIDQWSQQNEWLNSYQTALQTVTHGLIQNLCVDAEVEAVRVRGTATSYYGVQLAIHATRQFSRQHALFAWTELSLEVHGRSLRLVVPHPPKRTRLHATLTPRDTRQRALTSWRQHERV
ncbi:hypothetical protein Pla52o_53860 [Novipirellula galeiformis]|uniref:Uncharacterized protein n=1 Tax=Novipirellula galeiformis TaxID=2528004 RepID=A0A5C6C0P6_9BACT|nr:hypothetical protein [Novipirellula galeiformis]TWU17211.1 hypothetical protein Pla52o_53860 [Novipirellula galeiformis]